MKMKTILEAVGIDVAAVRDRRFGVRGPSLGGHRPPLQGWSAFGAALGIALLAGCSVLPTATPDLTRYYVLTSPTPKVDAAAGMDAEPPVRLVLRTVAVPEFLRGKIMPVRLAANELRFVDEARWAEPLEPALTRVVRDGLARRPGVRVVSRGGDAHEFEVSIQLRECQGVLPAGAARLAAHVEIFSTALDPKLVAQDDLSTDVAGWDGKDYGELAKKLSEAADALAGRIAALVPARNK